MASRKQHKQKSIKIPCTVEKGTHDAIYLRSNTSKEIEAIMRRAVAEYVKEKKFGTPPSDSIREKVSTLPEYYQQKLIDKGLYKATPNIVVRTVEELIVKFREWRVKSKIKESTIRRENAILGYIEEYLGAKTKINTIDLEKAEGFPSWLKDVRGLSQGTIDRDIDKPKHLFRFAVKRKYIDESPFQYLVGGSSVNEERKQYVGKERFDEVVSMFADNPELQAVLAFARWAALRIPSKIRHLKWSDFYEVDGLGLFFSVAGKELGTKTGAREVRVLPELLPYLDRLNREQEYLFEHYRKHSNMASEIHKILEKSGVEVWAKLFNNLRSSLMTDFKIAGIPEHIMDMFFGNTENVRRKHYINLKAVSDRQYAETLSAYWDVGQGCAPNFTPNFSNPREFAEHGWGLIANELGLKMTGKELLDGFLSSTEYQQALNGLDVVFTACKDFRDGKINERQVEKIVKKYLRRTRQDAADSIPELSEIFDSIYPARTRTLDEGTKIPCVANYTTG